MHKIEDRLLTIIALLCCSCIITAVNRKNYRNKKKSDTVSEQVNNVSNVSEQTDDTKQSSSIQKIDKKNTVTSTPTQQEIAKEAPKTIENTPSKTTTIQKATTTKTIEQKVPREQKEEQTNVSLINISTANDTKYSEQDKNASANKTPSQKQTVVEKQPVALEEKIPADAQQQHVKQSQTNNPETPVPHENHTAITPLQDTKAHPVTIKPSEPTPVLNLEKMLEKEHTHTPHVDISNHGLQEHSEEKHNEFIELQFENADLQNFVKQIEDIFEVSFITDDAIDPLQKGGQLLKGNKISFKTNTPLTRKQAWDLFLNFLQIARFAVLETTIDRTYRIAPLGTATKAALPSFIGTDYKDLPDNDEMIRFVYFIENGTIDSIKNMVETLKSSASSLVILKEQRAFILTDRAYNIKKLMEIVKAIDKVAMPPSVSVLKLKRADAKQVKELYDSIIQSDDKTGGNKTLTRKQPTTLFFPENLRIIAEPRTNALVLLGPKDATQKVEDFIKKYIDIDLNQPYSPLYVHQLQYADATKIAEIMNDVTQFGRNTEAGKSGGVRGADKYMQPMVFVPEVETNRLIIKGYYEDYLKAIEIIKTLDEPQPQVAIEILLLSVKLNDTKQMGAQLRSKEIPLGLFGKNIKFQTSGLFGTSGIVENTNTTTGVDRLLGNLLNLVQNASPGNTIVSLGTDLLGVWGIFQVLKTITNTQVISNVFLTATNKTHAKVEQGETRRVETALIVATNSVESFGDYSANLEVDVIPQINSDGMIVLDLKIEFDDFVSNAGDLTDATKNTRQLKTVAVTADREVLALGGLIRNRIDDSQSKVPILGDIPILGWLFKNQSKTQTKENLLFLISTRIIEPEEAHGAQQFTQDHFEGFRETLRNMHLASDERDPIYRAFFKENYGGTEDIADNLIFDRHKAPFSDNKRNRKRKRKRTQNSNEKMIKQEESAPLLVQPHQAMIAQNIPANVDAMPSSPLKALMDNQPTLASSVSSPVAHNETQKPQPIMKANNTSIEKNIPHIKSQDALKQKTRTSLALSNFLSPENKGIFS